MKTEWKMGKLWNEIKALENVLDLSVKGEGKVVIG